MVRVAKPNAAKPEARAEGMRFGGAKRRFPQLALRALKQGVFTGRHEGAIKASPAVSCREEKTDDRSA